MDSSDEEDNEYDETVDISSDIEDDEDLQALIAKSYISETVIETKPTEKKTRNPHSQSADLLMDWRKPSPKKTRAPREGTVRERGDKKSRHLLAFHKKEELSPSHSSHPTIPTTKKKIRVKDDLSDDKLKKTATKPRKKKKFQTLPSKNPSDKGIVRQKRTIEKSLSFSNFTCNNNSQSWANNSFSLTISNNNNNKNNNNNNHHHDTTIPKLNWNELRDDVLKSQEYQDMIITIRRDSPRLYNQVVYSLVDRSNLMVKYSVSSKKIKTIPRSRSLESLHNHNARSSSIAIESKEKLREDSGSSSGRPSSHNNTPYFNQNYSKPQPKPPVKQPTKPRRNTGIGHNAIIFQIQQFKEGYLTFKRKRRWVILDRGNLYIFKSPEDFGYPQIISLHCAAVRKQVKENVVGFELITRGQNYLFYPDKDAANITIDDWIEKIQEVCEKIVLNSIEGQNDKLLTKTYSVLLSPEDIKNSRLSSEQRGVMEMLLEPGNKICADCGATNPEWASINLGVFICIECSGIHRSFGTHISKVRSVKLDKWEQPWVDQMRKIGNLNSNALWEEIIPPEFERISESSNLLEKKKWLTLKYVEGRFRKDWEERRIKFAPFTFTTSAEFKEKFLQSLRDDKNFREDVRKMIFGDSYPTPCTPKDDRTPPLINNNNNNSNTNDNTNSTDDHC